MATTAAAATAAAHWLQLTGKTAIVTGAASGIGRAVVHTLSEAGCAVVGADLVDAIPHGDAVPPWTTYVQCDVSNPSSVQALMNVAFAQNENHRSLPSILVNGAGVVRDGWVERISLDDWHTVLNVNLTGTFYTCQAFLQHRTRSRTMTTIPTHTHTQMHRHSHTASIVNIGSVVSEYGNVGQVNYAASKGGVVGLTRALAKEVAHRHHVRHVHDTTSTDDASAEPTDTVRVNVVLPGFIATPMLDTVPETVVTRMQQRIALQRLGHATEVANVVAFLASERSSYVTGTTVECSGMIAL